MRRSIIEEFAILNLIFLVLAKYFFGAKIAFGVVATVISIIAPSIIEVVNYIVFRKENIKRQKSFTKCINGFRACFYRAMINMMELPTKAYISLDAMVRTIYRKCISKEHLLEWTTSEEADRQNKNSLRCSFV